MKTSYFFITLLAMSLLAPPQGIHAQPDENSAQLYGSMMFAAGGTLTLAVGCYAMWRQKQRIDALRSGFAKVKHTLNQSKDDINVRLAIQHIDSAVLADDLQNGTPTTPKRLQPYR